jgi:hypothetical protein
MNHYRLIVFIFLYKLNLREISSWIQLARAISLAGAYEHEN